MKKKRKWIKWVILAAVALLIVAWLALMNRTSESVAYTRMTAQQGDLTTYYNFDGTVRAKRSQTIAAQAADTVKTVYVAQNARVKKDDRLYKTESGTTVRAGIDGEVTGLFVHEGDVIAGIGDVTILGDATLRKARASIAPGQTATVWFWRDGQYYTTELLRPEETEEE